MPYSKTNQDGAAEDHRFLSEATVARIRAWQAVAGISDGPLFRPLGGRPKGGDGTTDPVALGAQEVARIFRRRARAAGLENAACISGHSARIGSANDLAENGATATQIQLAGGWKTERMVVYYTRKSAAGSNAMATLRNKRSNA